MYKCDSCKFSSRLNSIDDDDDDALHYSRITVPGPLWSFLIIQSAAKVHGMFYVEQSWHCEMYHSAVVIQVI